MTIYFIYFNAFLILISLKSTLIDGKCDNVEIPDKASTTGHCAGNISHPIEFRSNCSIICFEGCLLNDGQSSTVITCIGPNWSQDPKALSCNSRGQCDAIGPIQMGSSCGATSIGQSCTLTCNSGYKIEGNNMFKCNEIVEKENKICRKPIWLPSSSSLPTCNRIRQTCPNLKEPANGRFTRDTCAPGISGVECIFTCNNGFSLQPPERARLLCQENGLWTQNGLEPMCGRVQCPLIFNITIENGGFVAEGGCYPHNTGSTCKFFCNENYRMIGPISTTCLQNGQWSPDNVPPTCQLITCPELRPITNGIVEGVCKGESGKTCTFGCREGYSLKGNSDFRCLPTGNWDKATDETTCIAILCRTLENIANVVTREGQCASTTPGKTCIIRCTNGQVHDLTCLTSGNWDGEPVFCDFTPCPALYDIPNGRASGVCRPAEVGQRCNYTCNDGFVIAPQGGDSILCNDNGWDKSTPECVKYTPCPNLANPENGKTSGTCTPGGPYQTCSFTCEDGFDMDGSSNLFCRVDGSWDNTPPICNRRQCQSLVPPAGVRMSGSCTPGLAGMDCTFSCGPDYVLSGPKSLSCGLDGTWSGSVTHMKCVSHICPKIAIPIGGKASKNCSPGRQGRRCQISCKKGYKMLGTSNSLCTIGGRWVGKTPQCLRQCPPIRTSNARLTGQCSPYGLEGRSCTASCNPKYRLVGSRTAKCNANGLWSPSTQRCIRRQPGC